MSDLNLGYNETEFYDTEKYLIMQRVKEFEKSDNIKRVITRETGQYLDFKKRLIFYAKIVWEPKNERRTSSRGVFF